MNIMKTDENILRVYVLNDYKDVYDFLNDSKNALDSLYDIFMNEFKAMNQKIEKELSKTYDNAQEKEILYEKLRNAYISLINMQEREKIKNGNQKKCRGKFSTECS